MFTIDQIETAHGKVRSGADFPRYIQEIKAMGVTAFETWVIDSHTEYFGEGDYKILSKPMYDSLEIANSSDKSQFEKYLKTHQQGDTDYPTFCRHCAETGIKKWFVSLSNMTCTYYNNAGNEILIENIPQ